MTVLNVLTVVLCCVYFGMQGVKWFLRKELSKIREELGRKIVTGKQSFTYLPE